jgi:diadenylate cyclase
MIERIVNLFQDAGFTWTSALDVLLVAFIFFEILQFLRGTHALQMALGAALIVLLYWTAEWLRLPALSWLLHNVLPYAVFGLIVVFQAEIRKVLAHIGKTPFLGLFTSHKTEEVADEVVLAATTLASTQTGAIIVLEREMGMRAYIETGIGLDALVTYDLLISIFNPNTPLHDGAVVIQGSRIAAAACFLPLTVNPELSRTLGSRHRAAIGVTEDTDAVAVVVSEETGIISLVVGGTIRRGLDGRSLKQALLEAFELEADDQESQQKEGLAPASISAPTPTNTSPSSSEKPH